jgi:putative endonuclease
MPRVRAHVYILRCGDGSLYIGIARDVAKRLTQHTAGKGAKYTRSRGPLELLWQEGPMTLGKALRREYQLKLLPRAKKQAMIAGALVLKHLRAPKRAKTKTRRPSSS